MAPIQFIHKNGYGITPGRGREPHETIVGMTAEAGRVPGNAPHVRYPQQPRIVYGTDPTTVGQMALQLANIAKDRKGRRLRCDGVVLVAGVATYPIPVANMGEFASDYDTYHLWVSRNVEWLLTQHGASLVSIVEHADERHLHLHFFTLPEIGPTGRLNFHLAHAGRRALDAAIEREVQPAAQQAAYNGAMIDFQDCYYREVSKFFGHERYGPRRKRVERAVHKVNRQAEADLSRAKAALEFEYRCPASDEEADERSSRVSKVDFIAVAREDKRLMQMEIERLRQRLRDNGIDESDVPEPVSVPEESAGFADTLAMIDLLDTATPANKVSNQQGSGMWPQQFRQINAAIDQLLSGGGLKGPINSTRHFRSAKETRRPDG